MAQVFNSDAGEATSNSYATLAEANQYIENRYGTGSTWTTWDALTDAQKQEKLILGCDYIEQKYSENWNTGYRQVTTQRLSWPRHDAYYYESYTYFQITDVPQEVKEAQIEATVELISNETDLLPSYDRSTKSEKVGSLEVVYMDSAGNLKTFPKVVGRLRRLLTSGMRMVRG